MLNRATDVLLPLISIVFKTNHNRTCNETHECRSFRQAVRNEDSRNEIMYMQTHIPANNYTERGLGVDGDPFNFCYYKTYRKHNDLEIN